MFPVAFKINNFAIFSYGLMMVVAYVVTILVMRKTRKYENFSMDTALDVTIYIIVGGVIGARLLYVAQNAGDYLSHPADIVNIRQGGLSWHGALLGGVLGVVLLAKASKIQFAKLLDFAAVHSTLGLAIGRIGCFLNGCCYGRECHAPWAVEFEKAGIAGHRHPTQIYESILLFISFFSLLALWKKKKFDGELTMMMFIQYGIIRFLVEIFRENTANQYYAGLSVAQYVSIAFVAVFSVLIAIKRKNAAISQPEAKTEGEDEI